MATNLLILSELLRIDAPLKENRLLVTVGAQGFRYHVVSKYSISGWRNRCARTAAGEYAWPAARARLHKLRLRACSAWLVLSECGFANPLLDVSGNLSLLWHITSSNLSIAATHYSTQSPFGAL